MKVSSYALVKTVYPGVDLSLSARTHHKTISGPPAWTLIQLPGRAFAFQESNIRGLAEITASRKSCSRD